MKPFEVWIHYIIQFKTIKNKISYVILHNTKRLSFNTTKNKNRFLVNNGMNKIIIRELQNQIKKISKEIIKILFNSFCSEINLNVW